MLTANFRPLPNEQFIALPTLMKDYILWWRSATRAALLIYCPLSSTGPYGIVLAMSASSCSLTIQITAFYSGPCDIRLHAFILEKIKW